MKKGTKQPEETKQKMKVWWNDPNNKPKILIRNLKISLKKKGVPRSPETIQKIRDTKRKIKLGK